MTTYPQLLADAVAVLDRCDLGTPRLEVVWAAMVLVCRRADRFAELPIMAQVDGLKPWSHFGGGHRDIDWGRDGLSIRSAGAGSLLVVPAVTASESPALDTVERIGSDVHERIQAAVRWRDRADDGTWQEAERQCRRLLVQVWQRCRPGAADEQLDLFDLIGAA